MLRMLMIGKAKKCFDWGEADRDPADYASGFKGKAEGKGGKGKG